MKFLKMDTDYNFHVIDSEDHKSPYDALSNAVGGLITTATGYFDLPKGIDAFVNDEGLLVRLKPVLAYFYENRERCSFDAGYIVGNVVFCKADDGYDDNPDLGLSDEDIEEIKKSIEHMPTIPGPNGEPMLCKDLMK